MNILIPVTNLRFNFNLIFFGFILYSFDGNVYNYVFLRKSWQLVGLVIICVYCFWFLCGNILWTGPKSRVTHWKQTVLYLEDVLTICQGETITGSMTVAQNKKNPRDIDITVKYALSGRRCAISRTQSYKMR